MKLTVELRNSYDIIIEENLISNVSAYIDNQDIYIITDERVADLYLDKILSSINAKVVITRGYEKAKSLDEYQRIVQKLLDLGIERTSLIIAFGGGVIGDLAGFIASTLYRGIDYINIPTTLLSQVDSSIGGKVGINMFEYKNIVGCFYQPKLVLIDPMVLKTLPDREYSCGMAEVIKYSFISNEKILDMDISNMIYECLKIKKEIVEKDEFDKKERLVLNFGHTFGHAIEKKTNYVMNHGEAISLGMLLAIKIGVERGITNKAIYEKLESILVKHHLPTKSIMVDEYIDIIKKDKKNLNGKLNLVLLEDIGKPVIVEVKSDEILS